MKPYYTNDGISIYHGDCREVLKHVESGTVNCCVTSPPYFGLRDYGTGEWEGGDANCKHKDDDALAERMRQKKSMIAVGEKLDGSTRTRSHDEELGQTVQFRHACKKCGATRIDKQIGLEKTPRRIRCGVGEGVPRSEAGTERRRDVVA